MRQQVDNESIRIVDNWSIYYDMENKLVIKMLFLFKKLYIDREKSDFDGIPLTFLVFDKVVRVRKMTDEEFESLKKGDGLKRLLNLEEE